LLYLLLNIGVSAPSESPELVEGCERHS
jgi:hypothetical protein